MCTGTGTDAGSCHVQSAVRGSGRKICGKAHLPDLPVICGMGCMKTYRPFHFLTLTVTAHGRSGDENDNGCDKCTECVSDDFENCSAVSCDAGEQPGDVHDHQHETESDLCRGNHSAWHCSCPDHAQDNKAV